MQSKQCRKTVSSERQALTCYEKTIEKCRRDTLYAFDKKAPIFVQGLDFLRSEEVLYHLCAYVYNVYIYVCVCFFRILSYVFIYFVQCSNFPMFFLGDLY